MEYREHFDAGATEESLDIQGVKNAESVFTLADVGNTAICPDIYVVQSGDTYYGIAGKLGITVYELSGLNPFVDPDALQIGQQLCIPLLAPDIMEQGAANAAAVLFYAPTTDLTDDAFELSAPYITPAAASEPHTPSTPLQTEPALYIQSASEVPASEMSAPEMPTVAMPTSQQQPDILPIQQTIPADCTRMAMPPGWNFYNILMRYGISYEALRKANPGVDIDTLVSGQMICIPPPGSRGVSQDNTHGTHIVERSDSLETIARRYRVSAAYLLQINPNLAPDDFTAGRVVCVPN